MESPTPPRPGIAAGRASMRSEEVRTEEVRTRKRKGGGSNDRFAVDMTNAPAGWTYEWKRYEVYGKPDPAYAVECREQGWSPVPAERHPEMVADTNATAITRDGLILMERPEYLTREAKAEDNMNAIMQVKNKEAEMAGAPAGHFERDNKGNSLAKIKTTYDTGLPDTGMDIPD